MSDSFKEIIAREMGIQSWQAERVIRFLKEGASIPFMARYRKEMTGGLDEVQLADVRDHLERLEELEKRRRYILETIDSQGKLSPELKKAILEVTTLNELEDIYLPYKPKRRTRASVAREMGLEALAGWLMKQHPGLDTDQRAAEFIHAGKGVHTAQEALAGARDIMAEWISENIQARRRIRSLYERRAMLRAKPAAKQQEKHKYTDYLDWSEPAAKAPSHRILAMFRAEQEGFLKLSVSPEKEEVAEMLLRFFVRGSSASSEQLIMAVHDACQRLLMPSMENEWRQRLKARADQAAIEIFAANLRQLLLAPPLGARRILAIDPGFRSGCKLVCLDREGKLLHNETIYPHPPRKEWKTAEAKIRSLVDSFQIEAIAIGNGTGGRETEKLVRSIRFSRKLIAVMVNESGASVYSASDVAREEFPEYDVSVRGAVSIGRRLADPLAELVKIDPKSIGVGQYQHDVDQKLMKKCLDDVVVSCVNAVGVELNTASRQLLSYVSGIGTSLAVRLIEWRNQHGAFLSRRDLLKVPRFGEKAFEQSAGFLRVANSQNPLDNTAVHPESYALVEQMAADLGMDVPALLESPDKLQSVNLEKYISETFGLPTLHDIINEITRPGRDPRAHFDAFEFDQSVNTMDDLREGMILPGIVTNITAFGAFVDIGVHQDGLVHISEMADHFVSDPSALLSLNQKLSVRVLSVDTARKRIALSMKQRLAD